MTTCQINLWINQINKVERFFEVLVCPMPCLITFNGWDLLSVLQPTTRRRSKCSHIIPFIFSQWCRLLIIKLQLIIHSILRKLVGIFFFFFLNLIPFSKKNKNKTRKYNKYCKIMIWSCNFTFYPNVTNKNVISPPIIFYLIVKTSPKSLSILYQPVQEFLKMKRNMKLTVCGSRFLLEEKLPLISLLKLI